MHIVNEVLMDTGRILVLVLVSLAFLISALILFKPLWARALNHKFNAMFNTDKSIKKLERRIETTDALTRHRYLVGVMFVLGSVFVFWYSAFILDAERFIVYVIRPESRLLLILCQVLFQFMKWLFIVFSCIGTVTGALLIGSPEKFAQFSSSMDRLFSTDEAMQALDDMDSRLDSWVLKHHAVVGIFLFIGSIFLIVMCLKSFFS